MIRYLHSAMLILFMVSPLSGQSVSQQTARQEQRIALVIGNGNYIGSTLANPENDARSMNEVLNRLGFVVSAYENLNAVQMKKAIDEFGAKLKGKNVGLFYYAGHGIQAKGYNYLIPVDAQLQTEEQVEYDCVRADRVLSLMETSGTRVNVIILDACRNNPFERSWTRSPAGKGLAYMGAPKGTLIAYATSPGTTASDGTGKNGLYTSAILESIQIPGINIIQMFQNVRNIVSQKSGNKQIPWESTSLTGDFFFNPAGVANAEIQNNSKKELLKVTSADESLDLLIDSRDNRQYKTVVIGGHPWMAENLNYDAGSGSWTYENITANAVIYGRLYDWLTAKSACPSGWHLPGNEEWTALTAFLGGDSVAGGKMKETDSKHWNNPNTGATNESGFTALPGGMGSSDGTFRGIGNYGCWWSATEYSTNNSWYRFTAFDSTNVSRYMSYKKTGLSVRCVKD
jgi:uncharacterized protein (TIGR02145 family)